MDKSKDLITIDFPELSWEPETAVKSLNTLYSYVMKKAIKADGWYYRKKNWKRFMGTALRYSAIVFTAVAGIFPILGTIYKVNDVPSIEPAWSAVAVAIAALMIAIDKFGGFTSAWVRYILAAQELDEIIETFRFTWEKEKLKFSSSIHSDEIQRLIESCKTFISQINEVVQDETQKWVAEFQTALKEVDLAAKAAAKVAKEKTKLQEFGAISIEVENGQNCDNGWDLVIDSHSERNFIGKKGAFNNIKPGIIEVKAAGTISGRNVSDIKLVSIKGGEITTVLMSLN